MSNFLVGNVPYSPAWTDHGTGGGTSYTLPNSGTVAATLVFVGGAIQEPGVDFTISGIALTMTTSVTSGIGVISCQLYALGTINVPADDSVTAAKLDLSMTEGDLIYGTGADTWTKLAKGAASQQLAMNSGATAPEWVTPSAGSRTLLASATASSDASVDFTSSIDSTYTRYEFHLDRVVPAGDDQELRCKLYAGSFQAANYNWATANWTSTLAAESASGEAGTYIQIAGTTGVNRGIGGAASEGGVQGIITLDDPSNASFHTLVSGSGVYEGGGNACMSWLGSGEWATNTAVTGIQFYFASGNIEIGEFRMYGVA